MKEGSQTKETVILISREDVRAYCEAILEENPIYLDIKAARRAGYPDLVLPATYPSLFWQDIAVPWLEGKFGVVQTNQVFHYNEPLVANKTYRCHIVLKKVRIFRDKQFLYHQLYINNGSELAAMSDTTIMLDG